MRHSLFTLTLSSLILLTACADTTGLSSASTKAPRGNAHSSIVVQEFGDLQCPACGSAHAVINKPLMEKYAGNFRFEFKQFPLASIHENAMEAALASECAADQGKFWEFVDMDYENQEDLSSSAIQNWAMQLNLNLDLFNRCLTSRIKMHAVRADMKEGEKLGVRGTPTYFVNGEKVDSTVEAIGAAIDKGMAQANMPL